MAEPFPHFSDPCLLPNGRTWTAEFESYDMRTDAAYYYVTVGGGGASAFFVRVGARGGVPDRDDLLAQIAVHAEAGQPNTDYEGSVMWQIRHS